MNKTLTRKTILVVEDNPITRKMMRFALESEGHIVLDAADGRDALRQAREQRPDLVLQDFVLPDMDGLQLVSRLRELPGGDFPVLVITGMVSQLEALRARADARTSFLPKPLEPSRLVEIVSTYVSPGLASLGGGHSVLVVDDEALGRKLAMLRLRDAGFVVTTAASAPEALALLRSAAFDAVLSDVLMPGLDGFGLCEALRHDPQLRGLPIVLVSSSYVEEADQNLARTIGADALVLRTPDLAEAVHALVNVLDQERPRAPLERPEATEAIARLHRERIQIQLERQIARNDALIRQGAIQAAALSVVRGLAEALAYPGELPRILGDVLVHCLDAAGLSTGLLYLVDSSGALKLQAQAGLPHDARAAAANCFGHPEVLSAALDAGEPRAYMADASEHVAGASEMAAALGKTSVLVIPFVVGRERVGVLCLASDSQNLAEPSWVGFAQALATQFGQTIAVGQSLTRGARSEARYASLMEQASDAILILDGQRVVVEANRQAERLLGRSRAELVGRNYEAFVVPHEREDYHRRNAELNAAGTALRERTLLRGDGTEVHVEVSGALVRSDGDDTVLAIFRDVTERHRAQAEIRAARERLAHVVGSSPAVLYTLKVVGTDLVSTWVSPNIADVIGYSPEAVLAEHWWLDHLHPEEREYLLGDRERLLKAGHLEREYRFRRSDGSYCWIRDQQRVLRDEAGKSLEIVGSWWDISDRKADDLRLAESERRYRLLFEKHPQPLWVLDLLSLEFLDVNEAALEHYGYSRSHFLSMSPADIELAPASQSRQHDEASLEPRRPSVVKHRTRDGRTLLVEVIARPIRLGNREARLVLANDVTEKASLEAQFLQAQKMEAVGQLAGGVAHDFNNLLGVIMGYTDLLLRDLGLQHAGRGRVEQIRKAAERAAGLTRQLLAFSRKQVLEPRILSLNAVVTEIEPMLRRLIGEDVTLTTTLGNDVGSVRADRGQIEQMIMNLVVNSRDAMPRGGQLGVETFNVEIADGNERPGSEIPSGPYVGIAVADTGVGMDEATRARIFEPFFTTKGVGKGTGLGLSTVFGIVQQSDGFITVESDVERGSTFRILLPRVWGSIEAGEVAVPAHSPQRASETVLLVEDADALLTMVTEVLESAGYVVLPAADPDQALLIASAHKGPIHIVLTDVVMPGLSGPELVARLRATRPELAVAFMSGYPNDAEGLRGSLGPALHFIPKPFTPAALLEKLRQALDS